MKSPPLPPLMVSFPSFPRSSSLPLKSYWEFAVPIMSSLSVPSTNARIGSPFASVSMNSSTDRATNLSWKFKNSMLRRMSTPVPPIEDGKASSTTTSFSSAAQSAFIVSSVSPKIFEMIVSRSASPFV